MTLPFFIFLCIKFPCTMRQVSVFLNGSLTSSSLHLRQPGSDTYPHSIQPSVVQRPPEPSRSPLEIVRSCVCVCVADVRMLDAALGAEHWVDVLCRREHGVQHRSTGYCVERE
eukprot:31461-Rhodomonas_salina.2